MLDHKNAITDKARNVQVTPEFQDSPDLKKLWQALIATAINLAEKKKAEEAAQKGDNMT